MHPQRLPSPAALCRIAEFSTVRLPVLYTPPPWPPGALNVSSAPSPARLSRTVQSTRCSSPSLKIAPPLCASIAPAGIMPSGALPSAITSERNSTTTSASTRNNRLIPPPLTVTPGVSLPSIIRSLSITSCPLVRAIVPPVRLASNTITSPGAASAMACRSVPGPWSSVLVITQVVGEYAAPGLATQIRASNRLTQIAPARITHHRF